MKTLYFDCFSGISGDMTVGALVDAGADLEVLRAGLDSLQLPGFRVDAEKISKKGIAATQFHVLVDEGLKQPHRHLHHVAEIIARGILPEPVKQAALDTFTLLAEAEAAVHGTTIEKVHFHEVGAIDSIVDIIAAHHALYLLGVEKVYCSALHVGSGTIKCAHGVLPVPAPATAKLLQGKPTYSTGVQGELVTPTGAALVAHCAVGFGPAPPMTVDAIGYGSGTKDLADQANVLRVMLGEASDGEALPSGGESVLVLECNLDDMTGELFPPLIEALMAAGARDAFITPVLGKKGRPAHLVTVLGDKAQRDVLVDTLITHSTTLGVRMRTEERVVLDRSWQSVRTPWGEVRVKLGHYKGIRNSLAPEYEDCLKCAQAAGVPVRRVYEAALAAALKE
jgi:uncharacterized protein (TIGR00299 family) protein